MLPLIQATHALVLNVFGHVFRLYQASGSSTAVAAFTISTAKSVSSVIGHMKTVLHDLPQQLALMYTRIFSPTSQALRRLPVVDQPKPGSRSHASTHDDSTIIRILLEMIYTHNEREYLARERQERRDVRLAEELWVQNCLLMVICLCSIIILAISFASYKPRRQQYRQPSPADSQSRWRRVSNHVTSNDGGTGAAGDTSEAAGSNASRDGIYVHPARRRASAQ